MTIQQTFSRLEPLLLRLTEPTGEAVSRAVFGFLAVPVLSWLSGGDDGWRVIPCFVGLLFALRLVPMVVRKTLPFPESLEVRWYEQRQLAKRFDSYQWQKAFWIGIGLVSHMAISGWVWDVAAVLAVTCLASGASGLAIWRFHAARLKSAGGETGTGA